MARNKGKTNQKRVAHSGMTNSTKENANGLILHAKHAYMPNSLGHCGPDDRGTILELLHGTSPGGDKVKEVLQKFEAAYPFVRFIGETSSGNAFDHEVVEAYWIGNRLLDANRPEELYNFMCTDLIGMGKKTRDTKLVFSKIGPLAKPHHTFYVLNLFSKKEFTYLDLNDGSNDYRKIQSLIDNCSISWGKVTAVSKDVLEVKRRTITVRDGTFRLSEPLQKRIGYDREIPPFEGIKLGDYVSIHWNFAGEVLTMRQVRNLRTYTSSDIEAANRYLESLRK